MVFPGRLCYAVIMEELMSVDKSLGMQECGRIPQGIYEPWGDFKKYDEIIFVICYFRCISKTECGKHKTYNSNQTFNCHYGNHPSFVQISNTINAVMDFYINRVVT